MNKIESAVQDLEKRIQHAQDKLDADRKMAEWLPLMIDAIPAPTREYVTGVSPIANTYLGIPSVSLKVSTLAQAMEIIENMPVEDWCFGKDGSTPVFRPRWYMEKKEIEIDRVFYGWKMDYDPFSLRLNSLSANKLEGIITLDDGSKLYITLEIGEKLFSDHWQRLHGRMQQAHLEYQMTADFMQGYASGSPEYIGNRVAVWTTRESLLKEVASYLRQD
ncbi:hypothetical protein [Vibrio phage V-YDF132]|nr:hypothetical protein [Vibrio phage V-YDF132]